MKLVILNEDQMKALRDVLQDDVVVVMSEEMLNILCQASGHPPDSAEEVLQDQLDYYIDATDYLVDVVSSEYHSLFRTAKDILTDVPPTSAEYLKFR